MNTAPADLKALPLLPHDADGPVFKAPWEAHAFAMTLKLHECGVFSWSEWAAALSRATGPKIRCAHRLRATLAGP